MLLHAGKQARRHYFLWGCGERVLGWSGWSIKGRPQERDLVEGERVGREERAKRCWCWRLSLSLFFLFFLFHNTILIAREVKDDPDLKKGGGNLTCLQTSLPRQ